MRCTGPDGSGSLLPVFRTLRFQTVKIRTTHPKRAAGLDHQARAASCPLAPSEVAGITDREGRKTSYTYNAAGRQTADNLLNSSRVSIYSIAYAYDNASRLTSRRSRCGLRFHDRPSALLPFPVRSCASEIDDVDRKVSR